MNKVKTARSERNCRFIVECNGRRWDVSNLCDPKNAGRQSRQAAIAAQERQRSRQRKRGQGRLARIRLYPESEALPRIPNTTELFALCFSQPRRTRLEDAEATDPALKRHGLEPHEDETPPFGRQMVEVSPGHFVALRGSEETWHALQHGLVTLQNCSLCDASLQCIHDASMLLCPDCKMISLINEDGEGLGLGIKMDGVEHTQSFGISRVTDGAEVYDVNNDQRPTSPIRYGVGLPIQEEVTAIRCSIGLPIQQDPEWDTPGPADYLAPGSSEGFHSPYDPRRDNEQIDYSNVVSSEKKPGKKKERRRIDYSQVDTGRDRRNERKERLRIDYSQVNTGDHNGNGE